MARKKGGLGQVESVAQPEDLLDSVFGSKSVKTDTPPPAPAGKTVPEKADKAERVGKYFMLDKALAKSLKLYAVENDMKELAVIEASLRAFLNKPEA